MNTLKPIQQQIVYIIIQMTGKNKKQKQDSKCIVVSFWCAMFDLNVGYWALMLG